MPKGRSPTVCSGGNDDPASLLIDMPIALSLKEGDVDSLASIISSSLPGNPAITNVSINRSVGEAFTGGRSTPVYNVACSVMRPTWSEPRERHFVAKLVEMPDPYSSNDKIVSDAKLQRRRESYAVGRRFYDVVAPRIRDSSCIIQLEIPKLIASDRDGSKPHPAVCFLMNDETKRISVASRFCLCGSSEESSKMGSCFPCHVLE